MSQHTQEPWVFGYSNDTGPDDDYFREFFEITTLNGLVVARADKEADARLIAAAPDLLNALVMVLDDPQALDGRPRTAEIVRSTIDRATRSAA